LSGRWDWDYIDHTTEDVIYHYLERYSNNGSILDLVCGSGNTGNELDITKYKRYTGVDISEEAIQKAIMRTTLNHRDKQNEYFAGDILKYVPEKNMT
jgi:predicted TPR repeat methyltransferase